MLVKLEAVAPRPKNDQRLPARIAFRSGDSTFLPRPADVIWVQARRNYSEVHTTSGSFVVREVLASIERRLDAYGFLRVHRSSLINLEHVIELRRERRAHYSVVFADGTSIDVSPSVKESIERLLAPAD